MVSFQSPESISMLTPVRSDTDGHRRVVIEHTVYMLLLPGKPSKHFSSSSGSLTFDFNLTLDIFPPETNTSDSLALHTSASSLSLA